MLDGALVFFRCTELVFEKRASSAGGFLRGRLPLLRAYRGLVESVYILISDRV